MGRPLRTPAGVAVCSLVVLCLADERTGGQGATRRLATNEAIYQFPGYFHLQQVLLRGEFVERGTQLVLRADGRDLDLVNPEEADPGAVEVRGTILDVGRLERNDPRLGTVAERLRESEWPRPGEQLLLRITGVEPAPPAVTPSIRALALEPWKFEKQTVTLSGVFRGRNLFGDLPAAPGTSRYDFVLGGAEGAVWVVGMRPRGRGFDLDVDRRMDTNRWLQVTGVVRRQGGLVTLAASDMLLTEAPAVVEPPRETVAPPPPAVEVVFSAPTRDETDVSPDAPVRIQFSRGLRDASLDGRVRVSYVGGTPSDPVPEFSASYDAANRALRLTFARPLERFRTVRVDLLEGIVGFDGGPLAPWSVTFSVGGR